MRTARLRTLCRTTTRSLVALVLSAPMLATATSPASAQATCTDPPAYVPADDITPGMTGNGVTTIDGTGLTAFTIEVKGTLHDIVVPGFDLVVFEITDAAFLSEAHGVFSGMSGSPIWDDATGDLMGAVSFTFWPTDPAIGLFTPAEQMLGLLDYAGISVASAALPARVSAPRWLTRELDLGTVASAEATFRVLRTPFVVSGYSRRQAKEMRSLDLPTLRQRIRAEGLSLRLSTGGSSTAALIPAVGALEPGEPFSAVLSSGDLTWAGIGTTTFECGEADGEAEGAWGHEFFLEGDTSFAMGSADVMFIMPDPSALFGPYMVAEVADEVYGTVTQDRLRGLLGEVGDGPASFPVFAHIDNLDTANSREGTTDVYYQKDWWGPEIAFSHVWYTMLAAFDAYTGGTGFVDYTIGGTADGEPFTVTNHNIYYSEWSAFYAAYKLYSTLYALRFNRQDVDVQFTSVDTTGFVTEDQLEAAIVKRVEASSPLQPSLIERGSIRARPGQTIHIRVTLDPVDEGALDAMVEFDFKVPASARRDDEIRIRGGSRRSWFSTRGIGSWEELLDKLNGGEHPDDVVAEGFGRKVITPVGTDPSLIVKGKTSLRVEIV